MFNVEGSPQRVGGTVPVLRDPEACRNPSSTVQRTINKALNATEEGITMSVVPQCYEILLLTKTPSVAQGLCVCEREG